MNPGINHIPHGRARRLFTSSTWSCRRGECERVVVHPLPRFTLCQKWPRLRPNRTSHGCCHSVVPLLPLLSLRRECTCMIKSSATSDIVLGWVGWLRGDTTLANSRLRHPPSDTKPSGRTADRLRHFARVGWDTTIANANRYVIYVLV